MAESGDVLVVAGRILGEDLRTQLTDSAKRFSIGGREIRLVNDFVADEKLQVYFQASDVVALPFSSILNSGSLLLTMSFGRCVVAPAIGSIPEVACPEAWFGYDPTDADGLAEALGLAMACPDLVQRGAKAKTFAREHYDWSVTGRRARELYASVLSVP